MSIIKSITFSVIVLLLFQGASLANVGDKEETGDEAPLTRLTVLGVTGVLKKNIEARLPAFRPPCAADREILERYQLTVLKKIEKAARALGYYHTKASFSLQKENRCWLVTVKINKGPAVKVEKLDIQITGAGSQTPVFSGFPIPYKRGDVLNHLKYSDFKSSLLEAAQEKGYLAAKFVRKEILVDLKNKTATVSLHFNTGERFRYGEISVEQNILGEAYIRRYILLKKGDFFNATSIIEQQQLLQSSGYYSSVSVLADYTNASQATIPVRIILNAAKRNHYRLKLGFGTDTGIRSKASLDRRWTGSAGKKLNMSLGLSQRINEMTTTLVVPKENPKKNNLVYSVGVKREENTDVISESLKLGVIYTSLASSDWKRRLSLSHLSDKTRVKGEASSQSSLTLLGIQYAKTQADNYIFPKKGWRIRLDAEGSIDKVLSDASILQLRIHAKGIQKAGKGRLLVRTDWGTTFGDKLDNLPKDLRFFAGGINSIRGYGYESLGEINSDGKVIGGKSLLEVSLEYEYPVYEKWSIAGFVDAGNAFDDISIAEIKVGAGAGIRWKSPIGSVRLDVGIPESGFKDYHLHLSIGPDL